MARCARIIPDARAATPMPTVERAIVPDGIENFRNRARRRTGKFNGVPKTRFGLFSQERERRFNGGDTSTRRSQWKQLVKRRLGSVSGTAP